MFLKLFIIWIVFIFLFFPQKVFAQVVINEFIPNPSSGNDWVELYSSTDIDISGWVLDDEGTATDMKTIPPGISIGPSTNQFFSIEVSNRINQSSDTIYLYSVKKASLIDSYSYSNNPGADISFGRFPDAGSWGTCSPTKNAANASCTVSTPTPTSSPTSMPTPTSSPTPTPTPIPSSTPTPTPSSTKTPTPKSPTPKPTVSSTPTPTPKATTVSVSMVREISSSKSFKDILGTESAGPSLKPVKKSEEVKTLGANENNLSKILIGLGVIILISGAGIYLKSLKR